MLLVAEPSLGEDEKAALAEVVDSGWITMGDRVRALKPGVPARTAAQLWQLQFHCGKPPPAEDPRTLMIMVSSSLGARRPPDFR